MFARSATSAAFAQERLFNEALNTNCTHVLLMDSDVSPPNDCLEKMVAADKHIVAAPVWHYDGCTQNIHVGVHTTRNLEDRIYKIPEQGGLERIYLASFSCMLVQRKVLEEFRLSQTLFCHNDTVHEEFANSDNIFYKKADKLGFEAYVDWSLTGASHHKIVDISNNVIEDYVKHRGGNNVKAKSEKEAEESKGRAEEACK